jgi:hypothetical protein
MNNPHNASADTFDRGIVPAETAARKEREGENYKQMPEQDEGNLNTAGGYTMNSEGLINNFAVEPEMYIEEPGDLREEQQEIAEDRQQTMSDVNQTSEQGKLSVEADERGKGVGVI